MSAPTADREVSIHDAMALERVGDSRFEAKSVTNAHRQIVFGGQLLGQMMMAATESVPGKNVVSVQTAFARAARVEQPLSIDVDVVHNGRSLATAMINVDQGGRAMCRGIVLLDAGDDDLIRHDDEAPAVGAPTDASAGEFAEPGSEVRVVDGVDLETADATGPPSIHVWARFGDAPDGRAINAALAAWYTDMFVMGATMRPHDGVGFELSHEKISTGVLAHNLAFHRECSARDWMLISQRSTHAGGGRYYGTGAVHAEDGSLLASFSQVGMIRAMPAYYGGKHDSMAVM